MTKETKMKRQNNLQKKINEAYAKGYAAGLEETVHLSEQGAPGQTGDVIGGEGVVDFNDYTFLLSLVGANNDYYALRNLADDLNRIQLPSGVFINILPNSPFIDVDFSVNPPTFNFRLDVLGSFFGVENPSQGPAGLLPAGPIRRPRPIAKGVFPRRGMQPPM